MAAGRGATLIGRSEQWGAAPSPKWAGSPRAATRRLGWTDLRSPRARVPRPPRLCPSSEVDTDRGVEGIEMLLKAPVRKLKFKFKIHSLGIRAGEGGSVWTGPSPSSGHPSPPCAFVLGVPAGGRGRGPGFGSGKLFSDAPPCAPENFSESEPRVGSGRRRIHEELRDPDSSLDPHMWAEGVYFDSDPHSLPPAPHPSPRTPLGTPLRLETRQGRRSFPPPELTIFGNVLTFHFTAQLKSK